MANQQVDINLATYTKKGQRRSRWSSMSRTQKYEGHVILARQGRGGERQSITTLISPPVKIIASMPDCNPATACESVTLPATTYTARATSSNRNSNNRTSSSRSNKADQRRVVHIHNNRNLKSPIVGTNNKLLGSTANRHIQTERNIVLATYISHNSSTGNHSDTDHTTGCRNANTNDNTHRQSSIRLDQTLRNAKGHSLPKPNHFIIQAARSTTDLGGGL